jgi:hypothetical protein
LVKATAEPIAKRPLRIPAGALVPIHGLPGATRLRRLAAPRSGGTENANDNSAKPAPARPAWREALFLGILAATLFGAFMAGRNNAAHKVIIVPGPIGFYSVVT